MPVEDQNFGGGDDTQGLYKVGSQFKPTAIPDQFVGEVGDLFYSTEDTRLRISDGETVGGLYIIPDYSAEIELLQARLSGDFLPTDDLTINIGSPELRFNDIYGNNMILNGNLTVNGNFEASSTLSDKTITLADGSTEDADADGAGIIVDLGADGEAQLLYDVTTNTWTTNIPITSDIVGNVTGQVTDISNHYINDLADVDTQTDAPTDGQALVWDSVQSLWVPGTVATGDGGSGGTGTDQLGTVNLTGLQDGDILRYSATDEEWYAYTLQTDSSGGGSGSSSEIQWATAGANDQFRVSDLWVENEVEYTIRDVSFNNSGQLQIELATFSPTISATGQSLKWDQEAFRFEVSVTNPDDFLSRYIASVGSITNSTGVHTTISDYTTTGPSNTPDGGVDWTQEFTTNVNANIYSDGTGTLGGSASATLVFKDDSNADYEDTVNISYSWGSITTSISFGNLTGKNFLESYNNVSYTQTNTGLNNPTLGDSTVTATGGTVSNGSGSGTLTFTTPLHKDNNSGRSIDVSTVFTRPVGVTGTGYTVTLTNSDGTISASFNYPSFYIWTASTNVAPTREDIVYVSDFDSEVTELGHHAKSIDTTINNSASVPRAFWLGVRSSASQPTSFKTGANSSLLSDVDVTTGNTVSLAPDDPGPGYVAESYTLYGITLQPGNTYVRIS